MAVKTSNRPGRPRKDEGLDTRNRILDVALELFAHEGIDGTSMRMIARKVGVTESAIYAHFESKQAIYETLFLETGPPVVVTLLEAHAGEEATEPATEPATFLRRLVGRAVEAWDEPRARLALSMLTRAGLLQEAPASDGGRPHVLAAIEHVKRRLGPLFQAWMKAGLVKSDFPAEHLVWELFAPIAYIRIIYLHGQAPAAQRALARQLIDRHVDYFLTCTLRQPEQEANQ